MAGVLHPTRVGLGGRAGIDHDDVVPCFDGCGDQREVKDGLPPLLRLGGAEDDRVVPEIKMPAIGGQNEHGLARVLFAEIVAAVVDRVGGEGWGVGIV